MPPAVRALLGCAPCLAALLIGSSSLAAPAAPNSAACSSAEHHQFDFWLGNWDVFEHSDGSRVATARVTSILGGCVLLEEYRDLEGQGGNSFTLYDASRGVWHQSWVTDRGQLLIIEGHFHDGMMELIGSDRPSAGAGERWIRGTWQATPEGVREVAVRSMDGRKTWEPWFDLIFRAHAK